MSPTPQTRSTWGLSTDEVLEREQRGLVNFVDTTTSRLMRHILRANFLTRFNAILAVLFVVVAITGSFADGLFALVVVVNTLLGTVQEWRAKRTLDTVRLLHSPTVLVRREGHDTETPVDRVVIDDIVLLRAGDQIPMDATVIDSNNLEVNEANLTGEADSVAKESGDEVMSGTHVTAGSATVVATAVGERAHVHRLTSEARRFTPNTSQIHSAIERLLGWTVIVIVVLAPVQLWAQLRVFDIADWREAVVRSVAGLVGIIPEGLVLLTTLAFLTAAVRLTGHQVLVQRLPAVETLARVDVVCVDKTGTITTGEMVLDDIEILVPRHGDDDTIERVLATISDDPAANQTLRAIANEHRHHERLTQVAAVPFDSRRKWKAVSFASNETWYLGAPEMLLPKTSTLLERIETRARRGQRVLLLSRSAEPIGADVDAHLDVAPLEPNAIIAISERIRDDAAATIGWFLDQGVAVHVLSGDHPATVAAIASRIGLDATCVRGRVTPDEKRRFVADLQRDGHVVAMTGDGVNDVLALKHADIAIAMDNAAPATKAVSELLLMDGRFAHLPAVIAEGRRVIGNIERVAHIFSTKNAMSMFAIVAVVVSSRPFPFVPRQMTLLSSLTIGIPAFFLAIGQGGARQKSHFLRRVLVFALPVGLVAAVAIVIGSMVANDTSGTTSTLIALPVFLWITTLFAMPPSMPRVALLVTLAALSIGAFTIEPSREFFGFEPTTPMVLVSVVTATITCVMVAWWKRRRDHHG